MIRSPLPDVLGALTTHGPPLLLEKFDARCCIAATRLSMRVLGAAGYSAYPVAFWVRAANREFAEMKDLGLDERLDEQRLFNAGARYVEVDVNGAGYPAHLCAVVNGTLVDLSAGQYNRPAKQIHVPQSVCLDMPYDWSEGVEFAKPLREGGFLVYRKLPVAPDHTVAPDWRPERTYDMARTILDRAGLVRA